MNKKTLTILISILIGLLFDVLFWGHPPVGINYTIFIWACVIAALVVARIHQIKLPRWNYLLIGLIGFFSIMFLLRKEPFTSFLNFSLSFVLLIVLVSEFRQINWLKYDFLDWFKQGFSIWIRMIANPAKLKSEVSTEEKKEANSKNAAILKRVMIGLIITLPVLYVFIQLLGSADAVFDQQVGFILDWISLENLIEFIIRSALVFVIAWFAAGALVTAVKDSLGTSIERKEITQKVIGFIEGMILLVSVNLLFLLFTIIQFSYFFGGDDGRQVAGLTYSEYARQGFTELTIVAVFSLLIIFVLSSIYRETDTKKRRWLLGAKTVLVAQVIIILVSAFKRLVLYEEAFGFTRLRMYSHIYMIWLGILLITSLVLLYLRQHKRFAIASLIVLVGFAVTVNLVNVDGLILKHNLDRRLSGQMLDMWFLSNLSSDMLPDLIDTTESILYEPLETEIALVLACYTYQNSSKGLPLRTEWQEFHPSDHIIHQELLEYITTTQTGVQQKETDDYFPIFVKDGLELECVDPWYWD